MSQEREGRPRDLRKYARRTRRGLVLGALLLIVLVGNGLIWAAYGLGAARAGLLCTGIALGPVLLIVVWLALLDWFLGRRGRDG
jgi:hypothetical protein